MMSHTVTESRSTRTVTTSSSLMSQNMVYIKSRSGILKSLQLILGAVAVGLVGYYYGNNSCFHVNYRSDLFFLLTAVTFLIGSFLLWFSCLISVSTANLISQTVYEMVYHGFASVLYLVASILFIIATYDRPYSLCNIYGFYMAAAIIGFFITVLYLLSAIHSKRSILL